MSRPSTERNPIDCVAEEFAERCRRGERPSLTEYAGEIRELFPALLVMERLKPASADLTDSFAAGTHLDGHGPRRLGEYRILREVGRGGMGVVYEAVQESLGRHVALKVLAGHGLAEAGYLERFRREAKAAARLHHTNIVPVYGTGACDGVHFYAMQFIPGQGLDRVLDDLRRLRQGQPTGDAGEAVRSLCTGTFFQPPPAKEAGPPSETAILPVSNGGTALWDSHSGLSGGGQGVYY